MKKNDSMKEIEQLLELAPEVKDTRTKEEVFARLKKEGVFNEQIKEQQNDAEVLFKKRSGNRLATIIVAATALLTFGGVGGYLLSQNNGMDDASSGANEAMMKDRLEMEPTAERSIEPFGIEETTATSMEMNSYIADSSLVFPNDVVDMQKLHVGLVTEQLDVVPVTALVSTGAGLDYLDLYNQYVAQIDEEALGFISYHPLAGELQEGDIAKGELIHQLPENHTYDAGSAAEMLYMDVLNETFSAQFSSVRVVNDTGEQAQFAHMGTVEPVTLYEAQAAYFLMAAGTERYLFPVKAGEIKGLEMALDYLQQPPLTNRWTSPIVDGADYTVTLDDDVAIITFNEALQLANYNVTERASMFDALIMTAASYGMRVQFDNVINTPNNSYPLGEPIEKPIGANKIIVR